MEFTGIRLIVWVVRKRQVFLCFVGLFFKANYFWVELMGREEKKRGNARQEVSRSGKSAGCSEFNVTLALVLLGLLLC